MDKHKRIDKFLSGTAGGSFDKPMEIRNPLVLMFETPDGKITCHIHHRVGDTHKTYGLLICDLVRHVANAFHVDEDDVWEWVDKERHHHTTEITRPS
jgi:hypothetical protein